MLKYDFNLTMSHVNLYESNIKYFTCRPLHNLVNTMCTHLWNNQALNTHVLDSWLSNFVHRAINLSIFNTQRCALALMAGREIILFRHLLRSVPIEIFSGRWGKNYMKQKKSSSREQYTFFKTPKSKSLYSTSLPSTSKTYVY